MTVGANPHPFNRLVKAIDEMVAKGKIKTDTVIQSGASTYLPVHVKNFKKFLKDKEHKRLMKSADLIITHAGSGNIVAGFDFNKPMIIVPRREKYGEHVDDHQLDLAKHLEGRNNCIVVYDLKNLAVAIKKLRIKKPKLRKEQEPKILETIKDYVKKELNH